MRILLDYRPALRERTGVGEYVHQLARALAQLHAESGGDARPGAGLGPGSSEDVVEIFTSSWKDRLPAKAREELGPVAVTDRRVPVRLLNYLWHRLEGPPVEWLTGRPYDVVHSPHPLLLPSRRAAQVVTVHDLDFLEHPDWTAAEIRRDYAPLAADHARRADGIIVDSEYVGALVRSKLGIDASRVSVCPLGAPDWRDPGRVLPGNVAGRHVLFLGTLDPRKNVPGLLDAYGRLLAVCPDAPPLVLAGRATPAAASWLTALARPPLAGRVEHLGYVAAGGREDLLADARLLVLPSFDEGFGLPLLEAMSLGIPAVVSDRGSLPEVAGGAAILVDPEDPASIARGMEQVLRDPDLARRLGERGRVHAARFTWKRAAALTRAAYERAIDRRRNAPAA